MTPYDELDIKSMPNSLDRYHIYSKLLCESGQDFLDMQYDVGSPLNPLKIKDIKKYA